MSYLPILKKELKTYITSPVIYVVLTAFLVISGYFFYTNLLMVVMFEGSNINVNIWQYTFNDVRYVLMIMVPLISMRVFAQ